MKILIGIVVVLVVLAGIGFVLPTEYAVAKSVTIDAPPAKVHEHVGDLKKWEEFMPWTEDDPSLVTTFGEKTTGVGAHQTWTGKDGDGELTITKSDPQSGIAYDMAFVFEERRAPSKSAITYETVDGGTKVTWTMEGDIADMMPPVMAGYMGLMMEGSIGEMFDRGLTKLKEKVEAK
ncbi:MAG: SRPBCC family protein [Planctomycetota bacterium JB042]